LGSPSNKICPVPLAPINPVPFSVKPKVGTPAENPYKPKPFTSLDVYALSSS
jgi:hypothetical protein